MKLMALKTMRYRTRRMLPGDIFDCPNEALAVAFTRLRRAALYTPPSPIVETGEPPPPSDDLESLRAHARSIGIDVDGRWGMRRLQAEIAARAS